MSEPIDARVQKLVATLNRFPGIATFGSCGGHLDPGPRQWPVGTCYVKFTASEDGGGLVSIQIIGWLLRDFRRHGVPWRLVRLGPPAEVTAPPQEPVFALEGYRGTDPDELAGVLEIQRENLLRGRGLHAATR